MSATVKRKPRCPNGTRRNKKTGHCVSHTHTERRISKSPKLKPTSKLNTTVYKVFHSVKYVKNHIIEEAVFENRHYSGHIIGTLVLLKPNARQSPVHLVIRAFPYNGKNWNQYDEDYSSFTGAVCNDITVTMSATTFTIVCNTNKGPLQLIANYDSAASLVCDIEYGDTRIKDFKKVIDATADVNLKSKMQDEYALFVKQWLAKK
jgi:hypothetical protein